MIRRPPRSTPLYSSAASDVYKRQCPHEPPASRWAFRRSLRQSRQRAWDIAPAQDRCFSSQCLPTFQSDLVYLPLILTPCQIQRKIIAASGRSCFDTVSAFAIYHCFDTMSRYNFRFGDGICLRPDTMQTAYLSSSRKGTKMVLSTRCFMWRDDMAEWKNLCYNCFQERETQELSLIHISEPTRPY